jgi:hypothetical protein
VWVCSLPSLQLAQAYWVPGAPATGEIEEREWEEPTCHWKTVGEETVFPSTLMLPVLAVPNEIVIETVSEEGEPEGRTVGDKEGVRVGEVEGFSEGVVEGAGDEDAVAVGSAEGVGEAVGVAEAEGEGEGDGAELNVPDKPE